MGIEAKLRKLAVRTAVIGGLLLSGSACSEASKPILATDTAPAASATMANPPTQEATETAITTATATETATPKATEVLAIDQEKFHKLPASYEAFLAHPEAFIKSPYNPIDNPVEFRKWLDGPLSQALGDPSTREINVWGFLFDPPGYFEQIMPSPEIIKGQPEYFWFQLKDGTKVPVILLNSGYGSTAESAAYTVTLAIALDGSEGIFNGTDVLQAIAEGRPIDVIRIITAVEYSDYPNLWKQMVEAGFTGQKNDSQLCFGAGWMRGKK